MNLIADINPLNYHGVALDLDTDDKRHAKYHDQRRERGFDDTETWNLHRTVASFMLPRLKRLKEITNGHPAGMTEEAWNAELGEMIFSLEVFVGDDNWDWPKTDEEKAKADRVVAGIKLIGDRFLNLWW